MGFSFVPRHSALQYRVQRRMRRGKGSKYPCQNTLAGGYGVDRDKHNRMISKAKALVNLAWRHSGGVALRFPLSSWGSLLGVIVNRCCFFGGFSAHASMFATGSSGQV